MSHGDVLMLVFQFCWLPLCTHGYKAICSSNLRRRKMAEVAKHEQLPSHRNCVQFFRAWEEHQYLYILTEACQQSLAALADERISRLPEALLWNYALDLLQVGYCL